MKYRTILADPPWDYEPKGTGRNPTNHYSCMTIQDICQMPVKAILEPDAVLLLWAVWPFMEEALAIIDGWGFQYKTGFPWLKLSRDMLPRMGTGYHARACTEPLLIGTRGKPACPEPFERQEGVLFSKLGKHSAKPDAIYERAELYDGPYLEMFARPDGDLFPFRAGWTQIGNEITGNSIEIDLDNLANDRNLVISLPKPGIIDVCKQPQKYAAPAATNSLFPANSSPPIAGALAD